MILQRVVRANWPPETRQAGRPPEAGGPAAGAGPAEPGLARLSRG